MQAEMEITKCVASAILFHRLRDSERQRAAGVCVGGGGGEKTNK